MAAEVVAEVVVVRKAYPHYRVIVKNDDKNTFDWVIESLCLVIPFMMPEKASELALEIHTTGSAIVWSGPQEQAELYHWQLSEKGLTMAPLEACQ